MKCVYTGRRSIRIAICRVSPSSSRPSWTFRSSRRERTAISARKPSPDRSKPDKLIRHRSGKMRDWLVRLSALTLGAILLTSAYYRIPSSTVMTLAAEHFLASLTPEQRAQATFPFQDDERLNWHFIPKERKGLPLLDMTPPQKALAHGLLSAGLSQQGYIKAVTIMSLEDVLRILENADPNYRNPQKYYFSVFGTPSDTGTWGYRVEGHHLSQNFTVVNGKVAGTPSFFGANPAEVREGPRKGLRTLAAEEDLARDLLESLTPEQKKVAIVTAEAYKDILTSAARKAAIEGQPSGLSAAKMTRK